MSRDIGWKICGVSSRGNGRDKGGLVSRVSGWNRRGIVSRDKGRRYESRARGGRKSGWESGWLRAWRSGRRECSSDCRDKGGNVCGCYSRGIGWERGGHIGRDASRSRCDIYGRM